MEELQIPLNYRGHIIGRKGQTLDRIRKESGALLELEECDGLATVHIRGTTSDSVRTALEEVKAIVQQQDLLQQPLEKPIEPVRVDSTDREIPGFVKRRNGPQKISSVVSVSSSVGAGPTAAVKNEWSTIPKKVDLAEQDGMHRVQNSQGKGDPVLHRPKVIPIAKAPATNSIAAQTHEISLPADVVVDEWTTIPAKKVQKREEPASSSSGITLSSTLDVLQSSESTGESKKKKKKKKKDIL
jgi:hypothetical protein